MAKQTTVRLPDDLADDAEAVARVRGDSVNQLIIDALAAEIERVRSDEDFTARAKSCSSATGRSSIASPGDPLSQPC
jgi:predicted transcriptional regulator